mmetsp:Transcript_103702/g.293771  ORF Transcript_103702/g.293771 Transcript_103702/m.293771 type:complete len:211 (+) Transcript_103702:1276-1908(+)
MSSSSSSTKAPSDSVTTSSTVGGKQENVWFPSGEGVRTWMETASDDPLVFATDASKAYRVSGFSPGTEIDAHCPDSADVDFQWCLNFPGSTDADFIDCTMDTVSTRCAPVEDGVVRSSSAAQGSSSTSTTASTCALPGGAAGSGTSALMRTKVGHCGLPTGSRFCSHAQKPPALPSMMGAGTSAPGPPAIRDMANSPAHVVHAGRDEENA